jgi:nuclear transport factor 2 (NTF2) superfamily protein
MERRIARINEQPIAEAEGSFHWTRGPALARW